jgi:hypothetical protein
VKVRLGRGAGAGRTDRAEWVAERDRLTLADGDRREVQVGGVEPVGRSHAHGETGGAGRSGEPDHPARGRDNTRADGTRDVDTAVLPAGIRIVPVAIGGDDLAVNGQDPRGAGVSREREQRGEYGEEEGEGESHGHDRKRGSGGEGSAVAALWGYVTLPEVAVAVL